MTIQTDWNPEAEHGWIYEMVGDDPTIDKDGVLVRGPLVAAGVDTGVEIEIRSGGPAIGFQTVTSQLYSDDSILLGYVYTDEGIQNSDEFPTVAVMAGMEKNPQMIMWDPATYPDIETIADIGEAGILVRYFGGAAYMDYFTQTGILSTDQVDGSYTGTPELFIADEGASAQQGFGSAEPYIYENEVEDWGKPIAYAYINDAGWENYAESIAIRADRLEENRDCLTALVPIIQQSTVDYVNDPGRDQRLDPRRRQHVRQRLGLHRGCGRLCRRDDARRRSDLERTRRHDRQLRPRPRHRPHREGRPRLHVARSASQGRRHRRGRGHERVHRSQHRAVMS